MAVKGVCACLSYFVSYNCITGDASTLKFLIFLDLPDKIAAIFAVKLENLNFPGTVMRLIMPFVRSSFCCASKLTVKVSVH